MNNELFLSVVIPAYNEEKRLSKTLESVVDFLARQNYQSEVIVVSDGSTDKTVELANSFSGRIKNLKVIDQKENHGKGYGTRLGILEAKGRIRLFMDADNSTSIDQINNFLPYFSRTAPHPGQAGQGFDIVIGDRDLKGSKLKVRQPFYKELLGDLGNYLIQLLAVPGIEDTQCGFKAFSGEAAEQIFKRMTIEKWGFDIEALAIANKLGYKIKPLPVVWVNDPNSKVKLSGYANTLIELCKIKLNLMTGKYDKN